MKHLKIFEDYEILNEQKVFSGPSGDPFEYKVVNGHWLSRRKSKGGQWFEITGKDYKDGYLNSIKILDNLYPDARPDGSPKKTNPSRGGNSEKKDSQATNKSEETNLESWKPKGGVIYLPIPDTVNIEFPSVRKKAILRRSWLGLPKSLSSPDIKSKSLQLVVLQSKNKNQLENTIDFIENKCRNLRLDTVIYVTYNDNVPQNIIEEDLNDVKTKLGVELSLLKKNYPKKFEELLRSWNDSLK